MKKLIIVFLLFSTAVFSQVQQQSDKPTLTVTGAARISVKPDLGVLNISVSEIRPKMADAIKSLGEKSNYYGDLLKKLEFDAKEIKTTAFSVSKHSVYRDNKYIDSGYIASQNIRLEFVYSQKILQKIVTEFSKSEKPIDFNFDFELSEALKNKVQAQIIEIAVKDAHDKATIMSTASKVKLKSIKAISYGSWGRDSGMELIERRQKYASAAASFDDVQSFNFTPDDLVFRDTATLEWILE